MDHDARLALIEARLAVAEARIASLEAAAAPPEQPWDGLLPFPWCPTCCLIRSESCVRSDCPGTPTRSGGYILSYGS